MPLEDKHLIENAQKDAEAYTFVYQKYSQKVYAYFWHRVGYNKEVAEDLAQETFLRAFQHLERYDDRGYSYFSYLLRIAHNILVNYYRKKEPTPVPHPEFIYTAPQSSLSDVEHTCDSLRLWDAMQGLPINEQNALILYYWEDMPVRAIAQQLQKSENAVKLLLSRGRKRLAKSDLFNGYDGTLPRRIQEIAEI